MQNTFPIKQLTQTKVRFFLASLSFFFYYLSMPGSVLPWLTWFTFAPAVLAIYGLRPARAGVVMYLIAASCILLVQWWLIHAAMKFTELQVYFAFVVLIVFSLILAIPYALLGWLISVKGWLNSRYGPLWISASFVVLVLFYPTAMPANYAHSLYKYPLFIQLLDVGGVAIILFFVVLVNMLFVKAVLSYKNGSITSFKWLAVNALVFVLVASYGAWRIENVEEDASRGESLSVGIIQPKLVRNDSLKRLYRMTEEMVQEHPEVDLLVWPEFPTAFSYVDVPKDKKDVDRLIKRIRKPMVIVSGYVTADGYKPTDPMAQYYNMAHHIGIDRKVKTDYAKQTLVPFFEYLPWENELPWLRTIFPGTLRYIPGSKPKLFGVEEGVNVIPVICYEVIFAGLTHEFVDKGGNLIINLTNDIWMGKSKGSAFHFAMGLFRTVEHRVPSIRATNSGISGHVKATGEMVENSLTPVYSLAKKVMHVKIPESRSFYSRYGDVFLYGLVVVMIVGLMTKTPVRARVS